METSLGPKMLCFAINLWNNGLSLDSIRDMLDMFDARMCKTTVQNALVAVSSHMKPIEEKIRKSLKSSTYLKLDETPIQIYNKRGYVWVCVGDDDVSITVATTCGAIVLWEYYPHWNIPITCDGYAAYNEFHIRQAVLGPHIA